MKKKIEDSVYARLLPINGSQIAFGNHVVRVDSFKVSIKGKDFFREEVD